MVNVAKDNDDNEGLVALIFCLLSPLSSLWRIFATEKKTIINIIIFTYAYLYASICVCVCLVIRLRLYCIRVCDCLCMYEDGYGQKPET